MDGWIKRWRENGWMDGLKDGGRVEGCVNFVIKKIGKMKE